MPYDDIWKIESYDWKDGAKGKYLNVKYIDQTSKTAYCNVFDGEQQHLFQEAKEEHWVVGVMVEKSGRWVNVKSAEYVKDAVEVGEATPPLPSDRQAHKEPSGQETGMWYKELGEMIRAGDIDITTPEGKLMRQAYYTKMMMVLDLKPVKEKIK